MSWDHVNSKWKPLIERFWDKVNKTDSCWIWTGALLDNGYGFFWDGNKYIRAHRFSWELHNHSKIPAGMQVCHTCDNPACVNPAHLFVGTLSDNMQDMIRKGRNTPTIGERHGMARLTRGDVDTIRLLHRIGFTQMFLGKRFGVSFQHISKIVKREEWKHIPDPIMPPLVPLTFSVE